VTGRSVCLFHIYVDVDRLVVASIDLCCHIYDVLCRLRMKTMSALGRPDWQKWFTCVT